MVHVPSDLLNAVIDSGKIVLVVGAGCSLESPTNVPLSRQVAIDAHRRLVMDHVLSEGQIANPSNLTELARAVGNEELVRRLPLESFRNALPNDGYLIAAALLRERALAGILTLNYDLAIQRAVADVGGTEVAVLEGPADPMKAVNVIYLHRSARRPSSEWVFDPEALTASWEAATWEKVVSARLLASPYVLFVGLGSDAELLTATVHKIVVGLADTVIYQIGPEPPQESDFFRELAIPDDRYLTGGWCEFMQVLGNRVAAEQCAEIERRCDQLAAESGWAVDETSKLIERIAAVGLVALGRLRGAWTMIDAPYLPHPQTDVDQIATLVLAIRWIEALSGTSATIRPNGVIEFWREGFLAAAVLLLSARGVRGWSAIDAWARRYSSNPAAWPRPPAVALVAGAPEPLENYSLPAALTGGNDPDSLISPDLAPTLLELNVARATPEGLLRHFA